MDKQAQNVVTSENLAEFQAHRMGLTEPLPKTEEKVEEKPKEEPKIEAKEEPKEEPKSEEKEEAKEEPVVDKKSAKFRFSEITAQKKAAEARAAEEAKRASELEAKLKEYEAKLHPPKDDGKPKSENYTDAFKYAEDLAKWTTEKALEERDRKAAEESEKAKRETVVSKWREKQNAAIKEIEDYEEAIASSEVKVSEELRDAIVESDLGPKILYHFAKHPEEAERISKLTVGGALKELGRLEARLETPKEEPKKKVEVSKAPEPITPLAGGRSVEEVPIDSQGNFTGSPKQWRDLRRAGKIH